MNTSGFLKGVVVGTVVGTTLLLSAAAFAGSGIGGVFNLGTTNAVNGSTALQGSTNGSQLRVTNTNTGANASGIGIVTPDNVPPLAVHSKARVVNLNADTLDGKHASQLVAGGGQALHVHLATPNPFGNQTFLVLPGMGQIEGSCFNTGVGLFWRNTLEPDTAIDDWWVVNGVTQEATSIRNNSGDNLAFMVKADQTIVQQLGRPGHTATVTTSFHWTATGCVFAIQAVVQ
jgi:hypothetical protein